jgi:hypothetical protein
LKKLISVSLIAVIALGFIFSSLSSGLSYLLPGPTTASAALNQQQGMQSPSSLPRQQPFVPKSPSFLYPSPGSSPYPPVYQTQRGPPIANAAPNQIAYTGNTVMLDGGGSYDPNPGGTIVYYKWVQISGIPVTLFGSNTPKPTFIAPQLPTVTTTTDATTSTASEITLTFSLAVTDSLGLTSANPSTTNVIVIYDPQSHFLYPYPYHSPNQYPNAGQQQRLLQQNPYQQPQQPQQQQPPPLTGNGLPSSSYTYQNRTASSNTYQYPQSTTQYPHYYYPYPNNFRQYPYYQNQSGATNTAQYPHNTIPYLNSPQYQNQYSRAINYTTTAKQNNTLQKPQSVTDRTLAITTTENNKTIPQHDSSSPTYSALNPVLPALNPESKNSTTAPSQLLTITNPLIGNPTRNTSAAAVTPTTNAAADNSNVSSANQTKINSGVQFLGQTDVKTLKGIILAEKQPQLRVIPFHPRNPAAFVSAKREAASIIPNITLSNQRQQQPQPGLSSVPSFSSEAASSLSVNKFLFGFDGLTESQAGFNGFIFWPPDVQIAVGPNHATEVVNLGGEIFTKQGSSVSKFALPTFFKVSSTSDNLFDPKIIYDPISGRWFASLADATTNDVRIAVSTTNNPTGVWNVYRFGFANCPDQPIIGVNDDKFGISANDFSSNCKGAFTGVQYYIVSKSDLVNGITSPRFTKSQPDTSIFSLHPVQSLSSTSTLFMVSVGDDLSNSIKLFSFTGSVPNIVKSVISLPIQTTHIPPDAVQKGTPSLLATGDARVQDAAWYQGKLWLTFNDACIPSGDTKTRSCFRLDQIDTPSAKVIQDFDKRDFGIGLYYFYPSLRIDSSGNMDFTYGYSSANIYPSLLASGQTVGSPRNTLFQPVLLKLGSFPDTSGRYGDYFGAGVDPSNTKIIWVAGEYHSTSQWSTFISAIYAPTLHATALTLNAISSVHSGTIVTVTGRLTDKDASGTGIGGKTITFTGTGAASLASTTTNADGTFTARGNAPNSVATGWTVQAHFAGDAKYTAAGSTIQRYNTL